MAAFFKTFLASFAGRAVYEALKSRPGTQGLDSDSASRAEERRYRNLGFRLLGTWVANEEFWETYHSVMTRLSEDDPKAYEQFFATANARLDADEQKTKAILVDILSNNSPLRALKRLREEGFIVEHPNGW